MTDIQEIEDPSEQNYDKNKKRGHFNREEITEENCKFKEGQMLKFVKVRFPGHAKSYAFLIGKRNLMYGQKVVAMSDRGMAVGYINSFIYEVPFTKDMLPLASINKIATEDDITNEKDVYKKQKEVETLCQRLIEKHELDMNLTHVEFTQFGKKVVFYFVAPSRVDFRGLVKDLVNELKLRIELRQISVRDRAASQGALGPCGRELCCSSFLSKYGNVSIKMAKNQNLTLNYSKLNGVCGQLKCCLQYEDEVYGQKRNKLPNEGSFIKTVTGDSGKVLKLNILAEQFDLLTDRGHIRRYTADQVAHTYQGNEYKFPRHFDNISDDTATIIGLNEVEAKKSRQFQRDMEKINKRAKIYAHEEIEKISDYLPERDRTNDLTEDDKNLEVSTPTMEEVAPSEKPLETKSDISDTTSTQTKADSPERRNNNKSFKGRKNNRNRNFKNKRNNKNNRNKKETS